MNAHTKHSERWSLRTIVILGLVAASIGMIDRGRAHAAVIFVTNLGEKFSSTGGCSLQEAVYSANGDTNLAAGVTLQCVAGSGDDVIVLPTGALIQLSEPFGAEVNNPFGVAATPMITSTITIEGHGSVLQWVGTKHARLFTVASTGNLTIKNVHIKGFHVKGGNGARGGGGGMGAGGAVYVKGGGALSVEGTTFEGNGAIGGNGSTSFGTLSGGGGGLAGNGGSPRDEPFSGGGGGGGSRGHGGNSNSSVGAGGGGTMTTGGPDGQPGLDCGGEGGGLNTVFGQIPGGENGGDATCAGGGGGGGESRGNFAASLAAGSGGAGGYGGGGGGSGYNGNGGDNGGNGGFGGGGGAGQTSGSNLSGFGPHGGDAGFGGGGGAGHGGYNPLDSPGPGDGGTFGGNASQQHGGGGAGLGGAIFSHGGTIVVRNSTFTGNFAVRGVGGGAGAQNGGDAGGAIFAVDGSVDVRHTTISGNESTGDGAGIVIYRSTEPGLASLTLHNTIVAGNGARECFSIGSVTVAGSGNLVMQSPDLADPRRDICPGIERTADPQLSSLQLNSPGPIPTLAIAAGSPAKDNADATHALPTDQRGVDRPQSAGFDIGAYERCPDGPVGTLGCVTLVIKPTPIVEQLTMQVSPTDGGTTTPAPGTHSEPVDTVIVVTAIPNPERYFVSWTGEVADLTAVVTTVTMDELHNIVANFSTWISNLRGSGMPGANARSRATMGTTLAQPRIDLTWNALPVPTSGYRVLRATASGGPQVVVGTTLDAGFTDSSAGLTVNRTYYYVVHAIDAQGRVVGKTNEVAVSIPSR